jgi:hypothetical protein
MAEKQSQLIDSISTGVHNKLASEFKALSDQNAKLAVTINALLARVATLEEAVNSGTSVKRTVRTAGAVKKVSVTVAKQKNANDDRPRVTNSLLYFRYLMAHDIDGAREEYGTEENLLETKSDPTVAKRDSVKDEVNYWSAVGNAIWKLVLSDEQKSTIRVQHNAWKEDAARNEAEPQLEAEDDPLE